MLVELHTINEDTARVANELNSFSVYVTGTATTEYINMVMKINNIVERIKDEKPNQLDRALYMANRYSKKLAEHLNAYYRNEASCPSVMVCGPANFPTAKKNRQNSRRDTLASEYKYLQEYAKKIENLLNCEQPILSGDQDAIERLQDKIADLEAEKELMKAINAHFRKHGNLDDFEMDIPQPLDRHIKFRMNNNLIFCNSIFDTSNVNAEIKRLKDRLDKLQAIKAQGTTETETEFFTVVENVELMRLQLFFDDIPDETTRTILKSNGFKWSPKNGCWQRQLTDNARRSLRYVSDELKKVV